LSVCGPQGTSSGTRIRQTIVLAISTFLLSSLALESPAKAVTPVLPVEMDSHRAKGGTSPQPPLFDLKELRVPASPMKKASRDTSIQRRREWNSTNRMERGGLLMTMTRFVPTGCRHEIDRQLHVFRQHHLTRNSRRCYSRSSVWFRAIFVGGKVDGSRTPRSTLLLEADAPLPGRQGGPSGARRAPSGGGWEFLNSPTEGKVKAAVPWPDLL
jgi:hypothetical protein